MKILQLVAVMAMVALVVGLGARAVMTGFVISGGEDDSSSDSALDGTETDINDSLGDEDEIVELYVNTTNESESSSGSGGGGRGGGGNGDDGDEDEPPCEICNGLDDDNDGLVDEGNLCDDGNPLTIDSCRLSIVGFDNENNETIYGKECVNVQPNLYGQVVDANTGDALEGVNFSIYNSSEFDIFTGDGNYSGLVPKSNPDSVSNENGTYGVFVDPDSSHHMVMQGSDEKEFDINVNSRSASMSNKSIILPEDGHIKVYFEKASAALKSDLYIDFENGSSQLLVEESNVGQAVYLNDSVYNEGTEIKFHINVDGSVWNRLKNNGYSSYNHSSDSKYCQVERVDLDTWRLHFEDLPDWWPPDWDFNDAVVLVDIVNASTGNSSDTDVNDNDCDDDGIVNWLDYNDSWCDFGEENQEIYENDTDNESGKFNAEGHILFYGKYGKGNKYVCGDKIKFVMFGINERDTDETITFMIEDHTEPGHQGVNGKIVYNGSINNENESLTIPNNGTKVYKEFEFEIPCNYSASGNGKHDIHIMWNNNSRYHKIGNFFVIEDTTPPYIGAQKNASGFPNETITIDYSASDLVQNGTVREFEISINGPSNGSLTVKAIKDSSNPNDTVIVGSGGEQSFNVTYNESGEYNVTLIAIDNHGNNASTSVPVTVFITEEKADEIAQQAYDDFGLIDLVREIEENIYITRTWDRFDNISLIGDEYLTDEDFITEENISSINQNNIACGGQPYMRIISPATEQEYNNTLITFLNGICDCPSNPIPICP